MSNSERLNVYVGCSLTHAPGEYRDSIQKFKEALKEDYRPLEFFGLGAGSAQEVHERDMNCLKEADFMIAECTFPSLGLGFEIAVVHQMAKTIFIVAQETATVSRMILGIQGPNVHFVRYQDIMEVLPVVRAIMDQ